MIPSCHVDTKEYILSIQGALHGKRYKYTPDKILEVNLKEDEILNHESSSQ